MSLVQLDMFQVALTGDFFNEEGQPCFPDLGLSELEGHAGISCFPFAVHHQEIGPSQLAGVHGAIVLAPRVTRESVQGNEQLMAIGRYGVGYDSVDVEACTASDVLVYIASGAVDHSVAEATVGWMIALTHRFLEKDTLVRDARWNERAQFHGCELRNRRLGIIGLGGIGKALLKLLSQFGMGVPLAYDPALDPRTAEKLGVQQVSLDELLQESDFVSIHCPLTPQTRGMIGEQELSFMKPSSYLINTARGGIVDEVALYRALSERRIAGAAIDCFENEPLRQAPRLAELDNVILAPHCIAWTSELFREIGRSVSRGMVDLVEGKVPKGVINPEVLSRPGFQKKWSRWLSDK